MRLWNLKRGDPLALTLAADARLGRVDYCDDQIWELSIGSGEPPALAVQTTYGLRARTMRLFPRFVDDHQVIIDPDSFHRPPNVRLFFPNYLRINYAPLPDIDAEAEYWVPESKAIAGRLTFANRSGVAQRFRLDWVAQLTPTEGQRMAPAEIDLAPLLLGETANLKPVVILTGGATAISSPHTALSIDIELSPGSSRQLTWCHAALPDSEASFTLAHRIAARQWDAEIARLELLNASQVEIYTGQTDWDAALAFSQNLALGLFAGPESTLPAASFVLTRQPDSGYSLRGDGNDYNHLWNGQPALEAYYLANLLLPGGASLLKGVLRNYIASQDEHGAIDWKPGLGGQRSRLMAPPILASLAWRIYQQCEDLDFLSEITPHLLDFLHAWFTPEHDADGDGVPEWDHPMQAGLEDHPLFSHWHTWAFGADLAVAESPALCSLLYQECRALIQIAGILGRPEPVPALQSLADHLALVVENAWDEQTSTYYYWDRDSHQSPAEEWLGERTGPGTIQVERTFEQPARLLLRIKTLQGVTIRPRIIIHGDNPSGQHRIERLNDEGFHWHMGLGSLTGKRVYGRLEYVDVQGLGPDDEVQLYRMGFTCQDETNLLPLWAGIPDQERASRLVKRTLIRPRRYWRRYGVPLCPDPPQEAEASVCRSVLLPWNQLLGEGLLAYGYQREAAELVSRLMAGIVINLKGNNAFQRYYQADNGQASGERNYLGGLAPVGLFLEALGVRLVSMRKILLRGLNPFPWPVTVKYAGLTVLRHKEKTTVVFPDGQTIEVTDPNPCVVSLAQQTTRD